MSTSPDASDRRVHTPLDALPDRLGQLTPPAADLAPFLDRALAALCDHWPGIDHAALYLRDEHGSVRRQAAADDPSRTPPVPAPDSPAGQALSSGQPVTSAPASGPLEWAVPLIVRAAPVGVVCLTWRAETPLPALDSLTVFALALGSALESLYTLLDRQHAWQADLSAAWAQTADAQRSAYDDALDGITARLQQPADIPALLQHTLRDLGTTLGARRARVRLRVVPAADDEEATP